MVEHVDEEAAMLLRFVSATFDEDAQVRLGIFQTAYELRDSGMLPWYDDE